MSCFLPTFPISANLHKKKKLFPSKATYILNNVQTSTTAKGKPLCSFMRLDRGIILTPNFDRSSGNMHLSIVDMPVNMRLKTFF